jgi:drug/metabolite transporter (DMT)-like permease
MRAPSRLLGSASIVFLILIWGTTWAAIRIGLAGIPPFLGVALRFGSASVLLMVMARWMGIPLGSGRRIFRLWGINAIFTFSLSYGVVYWAEQWIPSGLAAVLFSTFPLFIAGMAHFWLPGERLKLPALFGMIVGCAGVAIIFSDDLGALGGEKAVLAAMVFLLSPASSAFANIAVKKYGSDLHPFTLTAVPMAMTAVLMGTLSLLFERDIPVVFNAASIGALIYLSFFGSAVTFTLYFWLLSSFKATKLSLITYGVPIVAVTVGILLLHEPYTSRILLGSATVLLGVALAITGGRWQEKTSERSR